MPFVIRYKELNTDLEGLYKDVVEFLQDSQELDVSRELEGEINGIPFKSVTATRLGLPKALIGTLREVTVTIAGKSDDFLIETHIGSWLSNMIIPDTGTFLLDGPLSILAAVGTTVVSGVDYQRKLKNKIKDLVKKRSKNKVTIEKVETFT